MSRNRAAPRWARRAGDAASRPLRRAGGAAPSRRVFSGQGLTALLALGGVSVVVAACGPVGPGEQAGEPSSSPSSGQPAGDTSAPTHGRNAGRDLEPDLQAVVDAAVADLRQRSRSVTAPIEVLRARRETFPDGALGCPEPGMSYTQALVDGYRVVLRRGERTWLYTAGPDLSPRFCPHGDEDGSADADRSTG